MEREFLDFLVQVTHLEYHQITPETKLADDIGFYGMDAIIFFEKFFEEFNIQNTDDFDLHLHIDGSVDFTPRPLNWIKNIILKERRKYLRPDVNMGHLNKVVKSGTWINKS